MLAHHSLQSTLKQNSLLTMLIRSQTILFCEHEVALDLFVSNGYCVASDHFVVSNFEDSWRLDCQIGVG